ncbi:MAG: tetratricopeptide repeat protein [Nitrospirae bacterium]|nr:tetratricopeptide repeat protein [Nitrospirota bacterium]
MQHRRSRLFIAGLFTAIGLLLYCRVIILGPFLFDDADYVLDNPVVSDISAALKLHDARQLGYLSFAVNYALGGEDPAGYHLFNVAVHIINSLMTVLLVLGILKRLNKEEELPEWSVQAALLAGLFFLVHPLQTQSVSYITQRFTSLGTLFYLSAVFHYLKARQHIESGRPLWSCTVFLLLAFFSTVAGMRTKEIAFTIPIMLFTLEMLLFADSRLGRKRIFLLFPFVLTLIIIPLSVFGPELDIISPDVGVADVIRTDKIHDLTERSSLHYLYTQARVIVVYLRLLIFPIGQRVIYDFPVSTSFFEPRVMAAFIFLASLAVAAFYAWKKYAASGNASETKLVYGLASIGIIWFFLALSVESSLVPIKDVIFEHRTYLPSVGFFAVIAAVIMFSVCNRLKSQAVFRGLILLFILLPLGAGTYLRNEIWVDELKLWDDVVRKAPGKAMGYNNRATAYAKIEDYGKALADFNKVIASFPKTTEALFKWENADYSPWNMSKTYTGRGNVYVALGDLARAEEDYSRAKEVFSMPVDAENLLVEADAYAKKGNYRQAIWVYDRILEWDPRHVRALNDRANAFSYMRRFPEAVSDLTRVIALDPTYVIAYHNRGIAYGWSGKPDRAVADFRQACKMGFEPSCRGIEAAGSERE